jgi:predicted dehydrogenase
VVASVDHLPDVAGIAVVTPTSTHADVVEKLLPRGVPIYCEKPLCDSVPRARRLAERASGRLFVMEKWRYHPGIIELARIAHSHELGSVVGLRTMRLGFGHPYSDTDCIWTLLPHELSIAAEILDGLPRPKSAVADCPNGRVMGLAAVSLSESGAWHATEVSVRSPVHRRQVTLLCRDGSATLEDAYADHLIVVANPGADEMKAAPRIARRPIGTDMPLLRELAAFIDHVNGGPPPKASVTEAAAAVEAIAELRNLAGLRAA